MIDQASGTLDGVYTCASDVPAIPPVPTATDNCTGNTVTINVVSDVTTPGNSGCTNDFERVITYTASDGCGNTSGNYTVTLTVNDDVAPMIDQMPDDLDVSFDCDANVIVPMAPTATDNCSGNNITVNLISDITTSGICVNDYVRVMTYTANDGCGNTSPEYTVTITVLDDTPPVVTCPSNQSPLFLLAITSKLPFPCPFKKRGTPTSTDAVQITFVSPNSIKTEPSAWLVN